MTKRTVPARVLILATLDLGRHDSHVQTSWFWTLRDEGNRRADTEGDTKRSRRGHRADRGRESGDQETPKAASSPPTLLFLERVPIDPVAGARLTWAMLLWAGASRSCGKRERERRSQEPWSPSPERVPRHPTPSVEEPLPGPRPLTRTIERRLRTRRGPMHTPRYRAVLRGSVQRKRPGQPSPTLPRHATPLLRPHTHQGPAPSYEAPQALPCPSHLAAPLTTILSLRHPRPHHGHVPKSQVRPRPLAGPRPATSSVLPRLRGARLVHVHPPLCWTRFGSHGSGWGWRAGDCHIASHSIFHRTLSKEQ